jgi:hypothetical protein
LALLRGRQRASAGVVEIVAAVVVPIVSAATVEGHEGYVASLGRAVKKRRFMENVA